MNRLLLTFAVCLALFTANAQSASDPVVNCCTDKAYADSLVSEINKGNRTLYGRLGDCYRDGRGVERSYLNMVYLYILDEECTGNAPLADYCKNADDADPVVVFNSMNSSDNDMEHLRQLSAKMRVKSEIDADAFDIFIDNIQVRNLDDAVISKLTALADKGSETAISILLIALENMENSDMLVECQIKYGDAHPMFLNKAGRTFWRKYMHKKRTEKVNDTETLALAEKCLLKSYEAGFLCTKFASYLTKVYKEYDRLNIEYDKSILSNLALITASDAAN